jgi:hypothetical protein
VVYQAIESEDGDMSQVDVTFDHCVFQSNRYPGGLPEGLRQLGLINMQASAGVLNISNCVFIDNEFVTDYDVSHICITNAA